MLSGLTRFKMIRRRRWQLRHYWSILRLRRKLVAGTTLAVVFLCAVWTIFTPPTYRATSVLSLPGLCPHAIIIGEPIVRIGWETNYLDKVTCPWCPQNPTP